MEEQNKVACFIKNYTDNFVKKHMQDYEPDSLKPIEVSRAMLETTLHRELENKGFTSNEERYIKSCIEDKIDYWEENIIENRQEKALEMEKHIEGLKIVLDNNNPMVKFPLQLSMNKIPKYANGTTDSQLDTLIAGGYVYSVYHSYLVIIKTLAHIFGQEDFDRTLLPCNKEVSNVVMKIMDNAKKLIERANATPQETGDIRQMLNVLLKRSAEQDANDQARHEETRQWQADIKESIEDRNKHRHEKWATVPDCVRLVFENKEIDNQDYGLPYPDKLNGLSRDSLRIKTQNILRAKGKREKSYKNSNYYNTRDIAEAIWVNVKVYPVRALITEFDCIGKQEEDIANRLE